MDTRIRGVLALVASTVLALGGVSPGGQGLTAQAQLLDPAPDAGSLHPADARPNLEPGTPSDPRTSCRSHPAVRLALPPAQARRPDSPGVVGRTPVDFFLIRTSLLLQYLDFRESLSIH